MSSDRFYIRFKGRVLGPLTKEKALEMVKRGQITRQHELSPDGTTWKLASEFTELFPAQKGVVAAVVETVKPAEAQKPKEEPVAVEWYAHFDGANHGPIAEVALKKLVASGKVNGSTAVWKAGMQDWVEAELVRPEWFSHENGQREQTNRLEARQGQVADTDIAELAGTALAAQSWILFVGVLGTVVSAFAVVFAFIFFLTVASSAGGGPKKTTEVMLGLMQIASWGVFLYICTLLLKVHSKMQAVKYQPNAGNFKDLFQSTNRFWSAFGMYCLVVVLVALVIGLMVVAMGAGVVGAFRE